MRGNDRSRTIECPRSKGLIRIQMAPEVSLRQRPGALQSDVEPNFAFVGPIYPSPMRGVAFGFDLEDVTPIARAGHHGLF